MTDEKSLRADRTQFELLVKSITRYAIYMLDLEGVVTSWNAGAERAKGYTEAEIIGQHFSRFFTAEDQAAGKPALALETARETGCFEDEGWRVRKDGSRFWALTVIDAIHDAEGRLVGFAKITHDMTEGRAAQEALAESEQRFRLLVTSVVDYALFMLNREGYITNWNPGAERIKRYTADEIVGRHFSIFYPEEDRAAGMPAKALETAATQGKFETEGWRLRKDGSRFWAHVVIDPIRDENGTLLGFAKITRDASDRRALQQAQAQLHRAQKMEVVGQLTGGVAHDFNNLLTAILGSLSLIGGMTSHSRIQRHLATAQRAAGRGAKLTEQLLAFARRQTLKPQTSNVNELIGVFEMLLRRAVGEAIAFELDLDPGVWLVDIDQAQFQSAVLNLVVNARDAMDGRGGKLTIETRNVDVDAQRADELGEIEPGSYVAICIRDTGAGMAPEVKAHAVEPFYTTKEVGQGSGLGLSQVYGFARQSKGQIEIDSEVGRGTTVRLYLPRLVGAAERQGSSPITGATDKVGSVLVVEDDVDVLEVVVEALRGVGYKVYSAANAVEALTLLQRDVPIDVLFTDIVMPKGMTGIELARRARQLRPTLRVLLSSGYPREALHGRETIPEDLEFIAKPYLTQALAERVRAMMPAIRPPSGEPR